MSISKAYHLLDSLQPRGIHYDLSAVRDALEKRGHPERKFKSIIVAGTNGKGSTSVMLAQMLRRLGFRTGLYSSPHLLGVRERIRCEELISEADFAAWMFRYQEEGLLETLTYYEVLTVLAVDWFAAREVEWAILEVGVGGRLDAVNLAPAAGAVIVSIDFDHRDLLGDTIPLITREKAGIIKPGQPVVIGELPAEARQVVENIAAEQGAPLYGAGSAFKVERSGQGYLYDGAGMLVVPELGLKGEYQAQNLGCAVAALERIVGIDAGSCGDALRDALRTVTWPGRFHKLSESPCVVLDGAHNPAGARALAASYRAEFGERSPIIVFAALTDKDHNAMLAALRPIAKRFWLTDIPGHARAIGRTELQSAPALAGTDTELVAPHELYGRLAAASGEEAFLVTGSLLFAGWFLAEFEKHNSAGAKTIIPGQLTAAPSQSTSPCSVRRLGKGEA